ncbi:MAG: hypothetical protein ACI841_004085 [Planctomycetota bacterium]|jgi:hypothetical protein
MQAGEPYDLLLGVLVEREVGAPVKRPVHVHGTEQSFELDGIAIPTSVTIDPDYALLLWGPNYGEAPVEDMGHETVPPLGDKQAAVYSGDYDVLDARFSLSLAAESGHLNLTLGGNPEILLHTVGHRFLAEDGYLVFDLEGGVAKSLTFIRDGGGTRRAVRR